MSAPEVEPIPPATMPFLQRYLKGSPVGARGQMSREAETRSIPQSYRTATPKKARKDRESESMDGIQSRFDRELWSIERSFVRLPLSLNINT